MRQETHPSRTASYGVGGFRLLNKQIGGEFGIDYSQGTSKTGNAKDEGGLPCRR
jgi:hypothetical protein